MVFYVGCDIFEGKKKFINEISSEIFHNSQKLKKFSEEMKKLKVMHESLTQQLQDTKEKMISLDFEIQNSKLILSDLDQRLKLKKKELKNFVVVQVILVNDSHYEVRNGLSGVMRDTILRLCLMIGLKTGDAMKVRTVIGMSTEHSKWRKHSYFLIIKKRFYTELVLPKPVKLLTHTAMTLASRNLKIIKYCDFCSKTFTKRSSQVLRFLIHRLFARLSVCASHFALHDVADTNGAHTLTWNHAAQALHHLPSLLSRAVFVASAPHTLPRATQTGMYCADRARIAVQIFYKQYPKGAGAWDEVEDDDSEDEDEDEFGTRCQDSTPHSQTNVHSVLRELHCGAYVEKGAAVYVEAAVRNVLNEIVYEAGEVAIDEREALGERWRTMPVRTVSPSIGFDEVEYISCGYPSINTAHIRQAIRKSEELTGLLPWVEVEEEIEKKK